MRGRHEPHIHASHGAPADRHEAALLHHPQQLRLQLQRQLGHLVEKERPSVGAMEQSLAIADRAGERTLDVPKEFALEQGGHQGCAVDGNEGLFGPRAFLVNRAGHKLFASAAFSPDQHTRVGRRDPADRLPHALHAGVLADQAMKRLRLQALHVRPFRGTLSHQHLHTTSELALVVKEGRATLAHSNRASVRAMHGQRDIGHAAVLLQATARDAAGTAAGLQTVLTEHVAGLKAQETACAVVPQQHIPVAIDDKHRRFTAAPRQGGQSGSRVHPG